MATHEVKIRAATGDDVPALVELGRRTFQDTYGHANSPDDLADHIATTYNAGALADDIADPRATWLVAEADGQFLGFAKLAAGSTEAGIAAARPAELNKLYVASDQHGRGLGRALLSACVEHARADGCDVVWLGVWDGNPNAIRFYERFGFRIVGRHDYQLGSQRQSDYLMTLDVSGADAG